MSKSIAFLSLERRIDALFARYTKPGSPGAVVAVAQGGEVEICKGYGLASVEHGVPITPQTRFRIASVSKQFTVTTALLLAAEGKLKLSDPPHKYLRELKPLPVTIDQMMRNSSGLPDFLELLRLGGHGLDKPARAADFFAAAARNGHLNFAPGSRFLYSNTNFLLLGHIIERLTKKKLGEVMEERIFKPLGMTSTMLAADIDTVIPNLATGYLGDDKSGFRRAGHAYPQGGEGGLTSTVEDLLIWSRHFDNPVLGKTLPAQLAAAAPLTGGHANALSPRRRHRRGARDGDGGPWRPVAGLPHRVLARAGGRSHRDRHRQSRQHRSVAAGARHRRRRPGRRQAAEAQARADHRGRDQADRRHLVQRRRALAVRPGVEERRGRRDPERHALRAGPPARRLVRLRARLVRVHASSPARARCASTSARAACCRSRSSASARPCRRHSPAPMCPRIPVRPGTSSATARAGRAR